jgi:hypothetical protein
LAFSRDDSLYGHLWRCGRWCPPQSETSRFDAVHFEGYSCWLIPRLRQRFSQDAHVHVP